jgi:G3E family GTPase
MTTEIFIISGFLGAGKTTLIQKLLKEAFKNEKVVLIENDFGEISVDAALFKSGSIEVKEINSGCICCSLSNDFVRALKELLERYHPDKIVIEPSGVGKLSDIVKACSDPRIQPLAKVKAKITVADVKRCKMYLDNFGEFFEDQIKNADVVLLSRSEDFPDRVNDAYRLMRGLNAHAPILSDPWRQIAADVILYPKSKHHGQDRKKRDHEERGHGEHCHGGRCPCGHQGHDRACACGHTHSAEEAFDTITIRTKRIFSIEDLKARVTNMERSAKGTIFRAKGIVRSPIGYVNLQYLPGDVRITNYAAGGDMLCFIGRNLNRQELVGLFSGE